MEIDSLNDLNLPEVAMILSSQFGDNYISKDQLISYQNNPSTVCLVAVNQDEVLGVSIAIVDSLENTSKQLLKDQDWFLSQFKDSPTIALRKHMAVKPGYEGQGIGSLLVKESVKRLKSISDKIITIVWKEGDGEVMHRLMTKNGFQVSKVIKDYWLEDSIKHQYVCPECKAIPCCCSSIIYSI